MNVRSKVVTAAFFVLVSVSATMAQEQATPESTISETSVRPFAPEALAAAAAEVINEESIAAPELVDGDVNHTREIRELRRVQKIWMATVIWDLATTYRALDNYPTIHETNPLLKRFDDRPLTGQLVGLAWYTGQGVFANWILANDHPRLAKVPVIRYFSKSHTRIAKWLFVADSINHGAAGLNNIRVMRGAVPKSEYGIFSYQTTPVPAF